MTSTWRRYAEIRATRLESVVSNALTQYQAIHTPVRPRLGWPPSSSPPAGRPQLVDICGMLASSSAPRADRGMRRRHEDNDAIASRRNSEETSSSSAIAAYRPYQCAFALKIAAHRCGIRRLLSNRTAAIGIVAASSARELNHQATP